MSRRAELRKEPGCGTRLPGASTRPLTRLGWPKNVKPHRSRLKRLQIRVSSAVYGVHEVHCRRSRLTEIGQPRWAQTLASVADFARQSMGGQHDRHQES